MLQWKSKKYYIFWVCFCSLGYPECNAHAPYFHLWPARIHHVFSHDLSGGGKMLLNTKCVFWISLQTLSVTFLILRTEGRILENEYWSSCGARVILVTVQWIFKFSGQICEKKYIKFHENQSSGSRFITYRRTDTTKLIIVSAIFGNAPKKEKVVYSYIVVEQPMTPCARQYSVQGQKTSVYITQYSLGIHRSDVT